VIKGAANQRLKAAAIELKIFGGINAGLFRVAQGFGAHCPQRDDQNARPLLLDLVEQVQAFLGAQIQKEQGWSRLL
jgi:hypothetical protein